jgi:hypothetical protein
MKTRPQCGSMFMLPFGDFAYSCVKDSGHRGQHKGYTPDGPFWESGEIGSGRSREECLKSRDLTENDLRLLYFAPEQTLQTLAQETK